MTISTDLDGFQASFLFALAMAEEFNINIADLLPVASPRRPKLRLVAIDGRRIDLPEAEGVRT